LVYARSCRIRATCRCGWGEGRGAPHVVNRLGVLAILPMICRFERPSDQTWIDCTIRPVLQAGHCLRCPAPFGAVIPEAIQWQTERSKKPCYNNRLRQCISRVRVLFVQHMLEKAALGTVLKRSFVVRAGGFGNCGRAAEGGIPRSSRFRWFAKSLAFMRVCPKARSG